MADILIYMIIGVFLALLFLNIYFRVKVFKVYKVLVQNKVEFNSSHIFNKEKMANEILPRYPKYRNEILSFVGHIKNSVTIAIILVILITILGFILNRI